MYLGTDDNKNATNFSSGKKVPLHPFNYLQRLYRLSHIAVAAISVKACDEI